MLKKAFVFTLAVLMAASVASALEINEVNLPDTYTTGDEFLVLNGAGTRVAFFNKVYVAGLWLEKPMTGGVEVAQADAPMMIRLHVLNDFFASSKHITDAFKKGFRFGMPKGDISPLQAEYDRLVAAFSDKITNHEEFDFIYIPGKGTSIYKEGELKDTIPGLEFKKVLFGIWVGEKATVNEDLTAGMLAGTVSQEALVAQKEWASKLMAEKEQKLAAVHQAREKVKAEAGQAKVEAEAVKAEDEAMKAREAAEAAAVAAAAKAEEEAIKAREAAEKEKAAAMAQAQAEAEAAARAEKAKAAELAKLSPEEAFTKGDVYFGFNSADLSAAARRTLKDKVAWMKANPEKTVAIEVYCDNRGSKAYNYRLAGKRAQSVQDFLIESGIDASRLEIFVMGAVASENNEAAWAKSRRAHFRIK